MLTFSAAYPAPITVMATMRQAWLAALAEAAVGALTALLLSVDDLDPEAGVEV
jgi:hypothetical protein